MTYSATSAPGFGGAEVVGLVVVAVTRAVAAAAVHAVRVRADVKALVVLAPFVALVAARLVVPVVQFVSWRLGPLGTAADAAVVRAGAAARVVHLPGAPTAVLTLGHVSPPRSSTLRSRRTRGRCRCTRGLRMTARRSSTRRPGSRVRSCRCRGR